MDPAQAAGASADAAPPTASLGAALQHIMTPGVAPGALAHALRTLAPAEVRDTMLGGLLPGAQDPLALLDPQTHTLGVLFILSARVSISNGAPVDPAYVERFCGGFDPSQARFASERVTMLAKGIIRIADSQLGPKWAIEPLHHLLTRFPPSLSYLTPLHALFVSACLKTQHTPPALLLPVLGTPIAEVSMQVCPDLHYNDSLVYHYAGGCVFGGWKQWADAEEFFDICVGSPAHTASAVQWDALKKLVLVQCISKGKAGALPKYVHPALGRLLKNSPYGAFVKAYPRQTATLREIAEKEKETFATDRNTGLINQALDRAARWKVAQLTNTYLTLGLAEIGAAVGISNEAEVRAVIVGMIEQGEITATLSADGTVTFSDPPTTIVRADVDRVLRAAQAQSATLAALEREIGASKEFLSKAIKSKDEDSRWGGGGGPDADDLMHFAGAGAPGAWAEEAMFS